MIPWAEDSSAENAENIIRKRETDVSDNMLLKYLLPFLITGAGWYLGSVINNFSDEIRVLESEIEQIRLNEISHRTSVDGRLSRLEEIQSQNYSNVSARLNAIEKRLEKIEELK